MESPSNTKGGESATHNLKNRSLRRLGRKVVVQVLGEICIPQIHSRNSVCIFDVCDAMGERGTRDGVGILRNLGAQPHLPHRQHLNHLIVPRLVLGACVQSLTIKLVIDRVNVAAIGIVERCVGLQLVVAWSDAHILYDPIFLQCGDQLPYERLECCEAPRKPFNVNVDPISPIITNNCCDGRHRIREPLCCVRRIIPIHGMLGAIGIVEHRPADGDEEPSVRLCLSPGLRGRLRQGRVPVHRVDSILRGSRWANVDCEREGECPHDVALRDRYVVEGD